MATPFHVFCPRQIAPYPAFSIAALGNSRSAAFNSCRHTTSGFAVLSQRSRFGRRLLMLLMLKVAIFIRKAGGVYPTAGGQGGRVPVHLNGRETRKANREAF